MERNITLRIKEKGFTLVELLVVIGVIGIISTIAFTMLKEGGATLALDRAAHKIVQDVRRTAQMTLRGESFTCPTGSMVGYGIHFDAATPSCYLIYAECDNASFYAGSNCTGGGVGSDQPVEVITLEPGVYISNVRPLPDKQGEILFIPPMPLKYTNGSIYLTEEESLRVTLSAVNDPSKTKTLIFR